MINKKYFLLLFILISISLSVNAIDESRGINVDPTIDGINTIITPRGIEVNPSFFIGGNTNGTFNSLQGPYLYNISETIYLNDSLFCLSNGTNCLSTSSGNSSWNQSLANTLYQPLGNTKSGSGPYLTNSSTSISVVENVLNSTIDNRISTSINNSLINVSFINNTNNFTQHNYFNNITINNGTLLIKERPITPQAIGAEGGRWAIITSMNGSYGSVYQENILNSDGQIGYGAYYLFNDGDGVVLTNRTIYGTQNEVYVGADGNITNYAQGFNNFNYGGQSGEYSQQFSTTNIILNGAPNGQSITNYNLITCGGNRTTCAGTFNIVNSTNSSVSKNLYGNVIYTTPTNFNDTAIGQYIASEGYVTINDPTSDQIALLINWSIPGTDINNNKYGIYLPRTPYDSGKSYFGDSVTFNGTNGTGVGVNYNTKVFFNDEAYFNGGFNALYNGAGVNDNGTYVGYFVGGNNTGDMCLTFLMVFGGGQMNFCVGADGSSGQFANQSVIQGNSVGGTRLEDLSGPLLLTASKAIHTLPQVNITQNLVTINEPLTIVNVTHFVANITSWVCNASSEGDMYYDGSLKKHRGCYGTDWNDMY